MGSQGEASPSPLPLKLSAIETILPSQSTDSTPIPLSLIDHCLAYVVDTVYFYPNPTEACRHRQELVPKLRQALSEILVPYHFLAGRLAQNPSNGMLELDCGRQGAFFASASCELAMADLGDVTFPNPAFRGLVLQPPLQNAAAAKMTDAPLLMMQVTEFKCGGFSIGFSMNHAVFDGQGALEFVMNFASVCRGDGLVVQPRPHDRPLLMPRNPPRVSFQHPEVIKPCDIPKDNPFTTADLADLDFSAMKLSHSHVFRSFPVSADMLNKLKQAAMSTPSCDKDAVIGESNGHGRDSIRVITKCSSFDAIAAHVWQARTKAIDSGDSDESTPAKALFAVDIRKRVQPPLPAGFVGNAILSGFASVPAKALKEGSLGYAVKKIQEAADTLTDEYIRSAIDFGAVHGGGVPNLPGGIFLSAWWKLPFFLIDFGFGKPVYAGPVVNAMVEFVLLLSNGTQEGLNVYIALEPPQMEKFERLLYEI